MKKAQITTFVMIGIVVMILIGMVVYFVNYSTKRQSQKNVKTAQQSTIRMQQLTNFINSCLEKATKDALILASRQSGYIFTDQKGPEFLITRHYDKVNGITYHVGYGNNENTKTLVAYDKIAYQLNFSIKNYVNDCINFSSFELQGLEVKKTGAENVWVELADKSIFVSLYYPIEVVYEKLGEKKNYESFSFNFNVNLKNLYDVADEIIDDYTGNPSLTDADLDTYRARYPELNFSGEAANGDLLINISDPNLQIKGQNYEFWFIRDNW